MMNTLPGFIQLLPALLNNVVWFIVVITGAILGVGVVLTVIFTFLQIRKKLTGRDWTGDNYPLVQIAMVVGAIIGIFLALELAKWLGFVNG